MKLPRWMHHLYAFVFGYFWEPCPICGEMFGGHEWHQGNDLMTSLYDGVGVCPNCGNEARRRNAEFIAAHPPIVIEYDASYRSIYEERDGAIRALVARDAEGAHE